MSLSSPGFEPLSPCETAFKRAFTVRSKTGLQHTQWLRERGVTDLIWAARWGRRENPNWGQTMYFDVYTRLPASRFS